MRWCSAGLAGWMIGWVPSVAAQAPEIAVDPRVELMTVVFRLAGNPEYTQCRLPAYERAIDGWFGAFGEHEAVRLARELRGSAGIGYDAPMKLAIHLGPPPGLRELVPLHGPGSTLESRWRRAGTGPFLDALRRFAQDTRFTEFAARHRAVWDTAGARFRAYVDSTVDFSWFGRFFGARAGARFKLVPGLCNGGANYGPRVRDARGVEHLYAVLGVGGADSSGLPQVRPGQLTTLIHEFNHSFVNPLVDRHAVRFRAAGSAVYQRVGDEMRAQAYGNWETMIAESLVRAAVIQYLRATRGEDAAAGELVTQRGRGFVWIGRLDSALTAYQASRGEHRDLASFMPRVASVYDQITTGIDTILAAWDAARPLIVSFAPANGATEVDPATTEIAVRFDRPMGLGYSFNHGPGGARTYPEVQDLAWDPDTATVRLRVTLAPNRDYEIEVTGQGFRSRDGVPLKRVSYRFRTRATATSP